MSVDEVRHDPCRDVATRVSDLPAADLLGCSACAFRHVQGRPDPGVATPTGRPAASGRQAATVVGGSSRHQRTGPGTVHDPSPAAVRHPGTLLRWHADLVKRRWTFTRQPPGRPPTRPSIRAVILRMARENPNWGYRRVAGELAGMGRHVGASTVWAILKRAGIDPCPRRCGPTWSEFLRAQAEGILACDVFHCDTVLLAS